jgi:hypothetical protein
MLAIVFGLLCGIALGLTGGGGSILAVPMLVYGIGLPFHEAVTISLLVVGLTALTGFLPKIKNGELELFAGILLAISGVIFAPLGSFVGSYINGDILLILFSILMIMVGIWSWIKSYVVTESTGQATCRYLPNGKLQLTNKCKFVLIFSGVITGFLTGLFGVGGGFLIVPALIFAAKMPIKKAITTSLLIIFVVSMSGFISNLHHVSINWFLALLFIIGGSIGMFCSMAIKNKLNGDMLQKIFAVLLVSLGILMILKVTI